MDRWRATARGEQRVGVMDVTTRVRGGPCAFGQAAQRTVLVGPRDLRKDNHAGGNDKHKGHDNVALGTVLEAVASGNVALEWGQALM